MAEEQRCQEGHHLCTNNCGFFGSPATRNLCSECYRDFRLKEDQDSSAKLAVQQTLAAAATATIAITTSSSTSSTATPSPLAANLSVQQSDVPIRAEAVRGTLGEGGPPAAGPSRCGVCRRRVGLTGFRCRCGTTFCGGHRYPEKHDCEFDYKEVGREAIAKANPIVVAEKLHKI